MAPKKLPPRLPLDTFKDQQHQPRDQDRTRPTIVIDSHLFLPTGTTGTGTGTDDEKLESWKKSIQALRPTEDALDGLVVIHSPPTWSLTQPLFEKNGEMNQDWFNEKERIIKIDRELTQIKNSCFLQQQQQQQSNNNGLMLTQVIWAPLYHGTEVLKKYLDLIFKNNQNHLQNKISGCCHLIQSDSQSPNINTQQEEGKIDIKLINSIKELGKLGLTLDILVDSNGDRSAIKVLDIVLELVAAVRLNQNDDHDQFQTKFILSQMGMPEMISSQSKIPSSVSCSSILSRLFSLSLFNNFEIKLSSLPIKPDLDLIKKLQYSGNNSFTRSTRRRDQQDEDDGKDGKEDEDEEGGFKEEEKEKEAAWREMKKQIKFYAEPILEAFGDHRVLYSSNFPDFDTSIQQQGEEKEEVEKLSSHYLNQFDLWKECLTEFGLRSHALDNVFGLNAKRCYGI